LSNNAEIGLYRQTLISTSHLYIKHTMKKVTYTTLTIIAFIAIIFQFSKNAENTVYPRPIDTKIVEDENESSLERKKWIEKMHKAAPETNWRAMDIATRLKKAKTLSQNNTLKNTNLNIANGDLVGDWREVGSENLAGRTICVEYDAINDSIYCASAGGNIWKASKIGTNWRCLNNNFKISNIGMIRKIPNNGNYRLLVSSEAWSVPSFWYSDDDGQTWNSSAGLSSIADWGTVVRSVVANDANRTIYLLAFEWDYSAWEEVTCLYVSVDKGISFTKKITYPSSTYGYKSRIDIWTAPEGNSTVYMVQNDSIFYIDNTFSPVLINNLPVSNTGSLLLSGTEINNQTYLYIADYENDNANFYKSADAGVTWETKGSAATNPFRRTSFSVSQKNADILYYGGMECYVTSNSANSWSKVNNWGDYYTDIVNKLHADIPSINSYIDASGNEFEYINTDGGTYISYNNLQTVNNISTTNLNISQYYSVYSHRTESQYIFAGAQDQGYQLCDDNDDLGTENFTQIVSGDYGHIVSGNGGNSIWMVYPGYAVYYPNAVTNPTSSVWWTFTCSGQFWIPPLMEDPNDNNKVYLGGGTTSSGTHLFHLTSTGSAITTNEESFDFSGNSNASAISAMAYSPINSDYRYVMNGEGDFFTSTDGGNTWTETTGFDGPNGNYLYGAKIVPSQTELGKVYVAGSGYSNSPVYISTDNGTSFSSLNTGLPNTMVYNMAITTDDKYLFAATDVGPYVFISENNQWYDLSEGFAPDQTYWAVDYLPLTKTVRFGTYGRGIWDFVIDDNATLVNKITDNKLLIYPNPTSKILNIENNTDEVSIYNLSGKLMIKTNSNKTDVSRWDNGVYIIKTKGFIEKFVKM